MYMYINSTCTCIINSTCILIVCILINTVLEIMSGNWPFAKYVASLSRKNCIKCLKNN